MHYETIDIIDLYSQIPTSPQYICSHKYMMENVFSLFDDRNVRF